jgi:ceramide glucosyltransferase
MFHHAIRIAELIAVIGSFSSIAYYLLSMWSARRFVRNAANISAALPISSPVSILKPLKGTDPEMYESFRSHCVQNYPQFEMIFGVSDAADPTIDLVERLRKEFPERSIRIVICSEILGANVKVSNLVQMAREARYDILLVNDSDIRVPPDYLRRITAHLGEPQIGMVTCLYRGVPTASLGSRLEALGISTDFSAGVLVAQELEGGIRFGLGSTLALRRTDLESIGAFEALVDYLADDYELGARIADKGLRVKLSEVVVETFLPVYSLRGFVEHQLRWGRCIRDSRPWGYLGLVTTFGLMWSLLALILGKGALWTWLLLVAVLLVRALMAISVGKQVLHDPQVVRSLWLLPLRDLMAVGLWIGSLLGHTVRWRGQTFRLQRGKLVRVQA